MQRSRKVDRYDRHITSTTPIRHLLQKQDDPDVPCSCGHDLGADETPDSKTLNTIVYVELDRQEELAVADNGSGEEQVSHSEWPPRGDKDSHPWYNLIV